MIKETLQGSLKGLASALDSAADGLDMPERYAQAAKILVETGVVSIDRPDKALRAASAMLDWKMTAAGGFTIAAIRSPDHLAIVDERGSLTYREVDERTNRLANALAEEGIGSDSSVAIMCRDHRWFVESSVALSKLGATALYYNTEFAGPQLAEVTEREGPDGVIYDEEFAEAVEDAVGDRKRWVAWDEADEPGRYTVEGLIQAGDDSELAAPDKPGKMTLLTSGSTGTPKGASRGEPDPVEPIIAMFSRIPLRAREPTVFAAPLFHAWGFLQFNLGLVLSTTYVLRRKFDPEATLADIERDKATALVAVPVMLQRILDLDESVREGYDLSSLRVVACSGGALTGDLSERWMDTFGDNLHNMYGSTEVAWAAIARPEDMRAAPGTVGKPPPGTTLRILDDDHNDVEPGESGQIFVGNAMLLEGYTSGEGEDMIDGFMATGDLGYLDEEGRLFVEGRSDDMIVSGGENVYPEEVEETLGAHDSVAEVAVIGVEDDEYGERLKAFVVKDGEVSEKDLKAYVKEQLAGYKVPREIEFLDELPRKPQGKVDKQKLKGEESEGDDDAD